MLEAMSSKCNTTFISPSQLTVKIDGILWDKMRPVMQCYKKAFCKSFSTGTGSTYRDLISNTIWFAIIKIMINKIKEAIMFSKC